MAEHHHGPEEPGTTETYVVTIDPAATQQGLDVLAQQAGVSPDATAEGTDGITASQLGDPEASVLFPDLGILIARGLSPQQVTDVQALVERDNPILAIEPERVYDAIGSPPDSSTQ